MAKPCGKAAYTRMDEMTAEDFAVLQSSKNAYSPDPAPPRHLPASYHQPHTKGRGY